MFIVLTQVDKKTKQPCTKAQMANGPGFPAVNNLAIQFQNESEWPVKTDANGIYLTAPEYYGICDDDSFTGFPGVLEVITTEAEFSTRKRDEYYARKHLDGFVFNETSLVWESPIPYPDDGANYTWDGSDWVTA